MSLSTNATVLKDRKEVLSTLSKLIKKVSDESISNKGAFNVGVSGGSLITLLKEALPDSGADFTKWRIFFCDERVVAESSTDSTFGQYKEHLLKSLNLKEEQFVKIKQDVSAEVAAEDYARQIADYVPSKNGWPKFDMLLLGMGPDGHTCSLFPGHPLLQETGKVVASITDSPKPPPERVTLTFPVINNAAYCVFTILGQEKATMIKRILVDTEDLPATRVKPIDGKLVWILDQGAGEHVKK